MIRVVIADDHDVYRLGLRALLSGAADVQLVGEAATGEEVLRLCTEHGPDVVLMDLSMNGMDGLEATRRLLRRTDQPRVLVLTMHEEEDYLIPALEAGASGYVMKASASATLLDAIRTVAAGKTWVSPSSASVLAQGWAHRAGRGALRAQYDSLSTRERDVFLLTAQGYAATKIGAHLHLSPKTVDTYRRRVNEKLDIKDKSDYIRVAIELDLLRARP